jgi:hypothetical protein
MKLSTGDYDDLVLLSIVESLSHDNVVFLDTNLVIQAENNQDTAFVRWFKQHVAMGKCCFITSLVLKQYGNGQLPTGIVALPPGPRNKDSFEAAFTGITPFHICCGVHS